MTEVSQGKYGTITFLTATGEQTFYLPDPGSTIDSTLAVAVRRTEEGTLFPGPEVVAALPVRIRTNEPLPNPELIRKVEIRVAELDDQALDDFEINLIRGLRRRILGDYGEDGYDEDPDDFFDEVTH